MSNSAEDQYLLAVARQEIEYLRRLYGKATDLLGLIDDADARKQATEIYHRIFTPDVRIKVTGATASPLSGVGPDAWVEVVTNALGQYQVTQHLIGTQLVELGDLEITGIPRQITGGHASMSSYLHAWHEWSDGRLRVVLGTYIDEVVFIPDVGWQIYDMNLVHSTAEHRQVGKSTV